MTPTQPRRRRRWVQVSIRTLIAATVVTLIGNVAFVAADSDGNHLGQTIPALSWIQLADHKGISLWNYELTINYHSDIFNAGAMISALFTEILWRGYLGCAAVAIWFIDWVVSFEWLDIITTPLMAIGDALLDVISRLGLAPAFLTVAALAGAIFVMRGKIARGIYEMAIGALVVALSATVLSNPIALVAGPDGWIYQARDHTLDLVAAMGDQAETDPNAITSELITTFIRQPVQLVSFGQILDGTPCETVYDDAVTSGPYGYDNNVRDAVAACNEDAGTYAENPSGGMVTSVFLQSPAGLVVLLIAILIGGTVMLSLVSTILASLKAIINLVLAVLPGGARRPLGHAFAEMFIGIATFVFAMFFLGTYLMVIQAVFRAHEGQPSKAFLITLIVMILGLIAFLRYRKALKAATNRLTDWMTQRPGAGSPRPLVPAGQGAHWMKAAGLYGASKALASPQGRTALKNTAAVGAAAMTGNPALASRVLLNHAATKKARTVLGNAATPARPANPEPDGYLAFSGRAAPRPRTTTTPSAPSTGAQKAGDDTVIDGVIVDPSHGINRLIPAEAPQQPRLPMRRVPVLPPPPTRPASLRPTPPRPELPPPPTASGDAPQPPAPPSRPTPPRKPAAPLHATRRPQHEPPPRTTPASSSPGSRQTRALRRSGQRRPR